MSTDYEGAWNSFVEEYKSRLLLSWDQTSELRKDNHLTLKKIIDACGRQFNLNTNIFGNLFYFSVGRHNKSTTAVSLGQSESHQLLDRSSHTHWSQFKGTRPDHARVESSSCDISKASEFLPMRCDTFSSNIREFNWLRKYKIDIVWEEI